MGGMVLALSVALSRLALSIPCRPLPSFLSRHVTPTPATHTHPLHLPRLPRKMHCTSEVGAITALVGIYRLCLSPVSLKLLGL